MTVANLIRDFVSLLFPPVCIGCGKSLYADEMYLCAYCWYSLPITNFHMHPRHNAASKHFWGRVQAQGTYAYLYLEPSSVAERLIHHLKYRDMPQLGEWLGQKCALHLRDSLFEEVDLIMPVPLHPKKQRKRGYNQSACFAWGLSKVWGIEVVEGNLVRTVHTSSQTNKKRMQRFENVKNAFQVVRSEELVGKHVLLTDDVFTTGATLEACAMPLLAIKGVKVSILTLAIAR